MKGKVETTIPQRQYENIRTTYYWENDKEKEIAIKQAIEDCIKYNDYITKTVDENTEEENQEAEYFVNIDRQLGVISRYEVNGVQYRLRKKNGAAVTEYWDVSQSPNRWVRH